MAKKNDLSTVRTADDATLNKCEVALREIEDDLESIRDTIGVTHSAVCQDVYNHLDSALSCLYDSLGWIEEVREERLRNNAEKVSAEEEVVVSVSPAMEAFGSGLKPQKNVWPWEK